MDRIINNTSKTLMPDLNSISSALVRYHQCISCEVINTLYEKAKKEKIKGWIYQDKNKVEACFEGVTSNILNVLSFFVKKVPQEKTMLFTFLGIQLLILLKTY